MVRDKYIAFRVSNIEQRAIELGAKKAGKSVSAYLRDLGTTAWLGAPPKVKR